MFEPETDETMGGTPRVRGQTKSVGIRMPNDMAEWVNGRRGPGISESAAYIYVLDQGRDLIEAGGEEFLKKLDGFAMIFGQERRALLKRILEDGMTALESELRSATKSRK